MAAVSVFVDDAVRGRLPGVCVRTGEPADLVVRRTRPVGGGSMGALWLLALVGPPGWLLLVVLSFVVPGREQLTVALPYTEVAWNRERQQRRRHLALAGFGLVALAMALLRPGPFPLLWVVAGALSLGVAGALLAVASWRETGISLDGSRRWVTLSRVHPAFARAVEAQAAIDLPRR